MAIAIMSAMREEIEALIHEIEVTEKVVKGMRTYYVGKLWNTDVVLVFSRWGKVASATTATHLITDFKVSELLFTGVAGAVDPKLNIGDLVIGESMYQHDMDASPILEPFEVPLLGTKFFGTDARRNEMLKEAVSSFLSSVNEKVSFDTRKSFGISDPTSYSGAIASGDQFISESSQIEKISKDLPGILCVEMEGAAVAQVCHEYKVPFNIVRTISDKANDNSHIDFPKFASEIASHYAKGIIKSYFKITRAEN
jgi:adenosylhomocysteine nucleosidase